MEYTEYNRYIAARFVKDNRLSIPVTNNSDLFFYHINLYGLNNKWEMLIDTINMYYNGNPNEFLNDYVRIRELIYDDIINKESYKDFISVDMNRYNIAQVPELLPKSKELYNESNIGKTFLSIDLKSANFQALKYFNPDIISNADSYEHFISKYTDLLYIKESKYFREVLFGRLNPKRQITIEKYLTSEVLNFIYYSYKQNIIKVACIKNDEFILEIEDDIQLNLNILVDNIKNELNIDVKAESFVLEGYNFISNKNNKPLFTFYKKNDKLVCVNGDFHCLTYKMFNHMVLNDMDYHFEYRGIDTIFNENFRIEKIS